jgi:hypothetical protein
MENEIVKYLIAAILLVVSVMAYAGWFGPSNYEDCVLDGMKSAKSATSANAVVAACYKKFNQNDTVEPYRIYIFSTLLEFLPAVNELVNKIELTNYAASKNDELYISSNGGWVSGRRLNVEVMNRNGFQLEGVEVGIPKYSTCGPYQSDYAEVYKCLDSSAPPFGSGQFKCEIPRLDSRKIDELCITGFAIYSSRSGVFTFMKNNNIPRPKK